MQKVEESERFKKQLSAEQAEQIAKDYYESRYEQFFQFGQVPSLEDCENDYKKTGSHALFSLLFLEKSKPEQQLLYKELQKYKTQMYDLYDRYREIEKPLFYKSLAPGKTEAKQCSKGTLYKLLPDNNHYLQYHTVPGRDYLIQLGIHLGLSRDAVDRILRYSERGALYPVYFLDVVIMSYLDRERGENSPEDIIEQVRTIMQEAIIESEWANSLDETCEEEEKENRRNVVAGSRVDGKEDDATLTTLADRVYRQNKTGFDRVCEDFSEFYRRKRYGLIMQTKRFIRDSDAYRKYRTAYLHKPKISPRMEDTGKVRDLYNIYRLGTAAFGQDLGPDTADVREKTVVNHILKGRKDGGLYHQINPTKTELIRLAVAAGKEDEAGAYLKRAGLWEQNYIGKEEAPENEMDATDLLILYLVKIRDLEVEKQLVKDPGRDITIEKKTGKEAYDLIRLCRQISKDILFAKFFAVDRISSEKPHLMNEYLKELDHLMDRMIFPVGEECDDGWYRLSKQRLGIS